ncbi:hypothetical protein DRF59_16380 [Chryseobacterium flavum]|uniref:Uncharacterized protein n=1 Tax=Chryseobacterium flavum TaxID=415851 RepID=A0A3D9CHU0_9FLAO|nr:hypothetical protein DRF59_16380 [Chryseobacterium flavum]
MQIILYIWIDINDEKLWREVLLYCFQGIAFSGIWNSGQNIISGNRSMMFVKNSSRLFFSLLYLFIIFVETYF